MANVKLSNVEKEYEDGFKAVKNINLDIYDKEFVVLVGPSGCGKSTTLRMIAGLEEISSGEIYIEEDIVNGKSPKNRDIAMVFQNYALYPHMSVKDNIAFPLKMKRIKKEKIEEKVGEIARSLQIENLLNKKPAQLSGGQRQRVALGRAMVRNPKVFLLDEPLSNLDAKLRIAMRSEIVNLHKKLNTTFIYVTHDQVEAMTMGDRIAVLNAGKVEQFDTPLNLYYQPVNKFVAEFIGTPKINIFHTTFKRKDNKLFLKIFGIYIEIGKEEVDKFAGIQEEETYYIGIRAEDFYMDEKSNISIKFSNIEYMGSDIYAYAYAEESEEAIVMRFTLEDRVKDNEIRKVNVDVKKLYIFDKWTEQTIYSPKNEA